MPSRAVAPKSRQKNEAAVPIVECPPELSPIARKEWDRVAPELANAGRLTQLDRAPLALYCTAYADWIAATEALQAFGAVMKSPSDYPVQSPYVSILFKNADLMIRLAAEFGFTPASRRRVPTASKSDWFSDIPNLQDLDLKPLDIE